MAGKRFYTAANNRTSDSLITFLGDRLGHDRRYAIDNDIIKTELRYAPIEFFETGISKTIDWYFTNETWWQQIFDGGYNEGSKRTMSDVSFI